MKDRIARPQTGETDEQSGDLDQLINGALLRFDDESNGVDYDKPDYPVGWDAVHKLQRRADAATLATAVALCKSADDKRRRVGAAILAQFGHCSDIPRGVFREERYRALEELLLTEMATAANPGVLGQVCLAFGHLGDRRAVPITLKLIDHPNSDVRFDVVFALSGGECPKEEAAIAALIKLSTDDDVHVRDWATFGLKERITAESVAIRTALYARLTDDDDQVIIEAIGGLARRKDKTVLPALTRALREQAGISPDAAEGMAAPQLCAGLREARRLLEAQRSGVPPAVLWNKDWLEAMEACGCQLERDDLIGLSEEGELRE